TRSRLHTISKLDWSLDVCSSDLITCNFMNRYCTTIHKMACDTEEKCFDDKFNDRLFSLMALRDTEIENIAKNVEKEPEIEKSDKIGRASCRERGRIKDIYI